MKPFLIRRISKTADGREIVRALEPFYTAGRLDRLEDGRYALK